MEVAAEGGGDGGEFLGGAEGVQVGEGEGGGGAVVGDVEGLDGGCGEGED